MGGDLVLQSSVPGQGSCFVATVQLGVGRSTPAELQARASAPVQLRRVLVVGCEVHSTGIDLTDEGRDVAVLFGDGAGAVVLELAGRLARRGRRAGERRRARRAAAGRREE